MRQEDLEPISKQGDKLTNNHIETYHADLCKLFLDALFGLSCRESSHSFVCLNHLAYIPCAVIELSAHSVDGFFFIDCGSSDPISYQDQALRCLRASTAASPYLLFSLCSLRAGWVIPLRRLRSLIAPSPFSALNGEEYISKDMKPN